MATKENPEGMTSEEILSLDDEAMSQMLTPPKLLVREGAQDEGQDAEEDEEDGENEGSSASSQAAKDQGAGSQDDDDGASAADGTVDADGDGDDKGEPSDKKKADPKPGNMGKEAADQGRDPKPGSDDKGDGKGEDNADPKAGATEKVDYKAAYERMMAPFKANGKMIKVESPDEAIQLMQMGANYTKKIQALQPGLKVLRMLENHGLLDETKLSYLIDLSRKDPAAVKKLVKESGVDPMDIDTSKDPGYKPGNYQVSDEEMAFTNVIRDVGSEQGGRELLRSIQQTWDKRSKDAILKDPDILRVVNEQRVNGIYAKINAEIERRRMIGKISETTPFLEAYRVVGEEMQRSGALAVPAANPQASQPTSKVPQQAPANTGSNTPGGNRRVVDQRVAPRKPSGAPNVSDRVRAASAAPASSAKPGGKSDFNPLAMSDEDFNKAFATGKRY
ncbi:MAG: hypothetical protein ACT4OK_11005 [Gemmobacter sp.]